MIKERLEEELGKAHKVMVGSTEQFQGQEKEAMVLTTARSSLTCMKEGTGGIGQKCVCFLCEIFRFK